MLLIKNFKGVDFFMYPNIDDDYMRPAVPELYPMDPYGESMSDYHEHTPDCYEHMPIYHDPMMPHPHMPCRCPLMMDPNFRRCLQICMMQHECGKPIYIEETMSLDSYYETTEDIEKE